MTVACDLFSEFHQKCLDLKRQNKKFHVEDSLVSLRMPIHISLEDIKPYLLSLNKKVCIVCATLKSCSKVQKDHPEFEYCSTRQVMEYRWGTPKNVGSWYSSDLFVVLNYSQYDDNNQRYVRHISKVPQNGKDPEFLAMFIN